MADERRVAQLGGLFVHRHGDDRPNAPGQRIERGPFHIAAGRRPRRAVELAGSVVGRGQQLEVDDRERVPVDVEPEEPGPVSKNRLVAVDHDPGRVDLPISKRA